MNASEPVEGTGHRPFNLRDDVEIPGKVTGLNSDGKIQVTYASGLFDWHEPFDVNGVATKLRCDPAQDAVDHDPVSAPRHYRSHPSGIECIQVTEHMGFNLGNAVKYLWRADLKGDAIEDLRKAAWYLDREITRRECAEGSAVRDDIDVAQLPVRPAGPIRRFRGLFTRCDGAA